MSGLLVGTSFPPFLVIGADWILLTYLGAKVCVISLHPTRYISGVREHLRDVVFLDSGKITFLLYFLYFPIWFLGNNIFLFEEKRKYFLVSIPKKIK